MSLLSLLEQGAGFVALSALGAGVLYLLTRPHALWRIAALLTGGALWLALATLAARLVQTASPAARSAAGAGFLLTLLALFVFTTRVNLDGTP